MHYDLIIKNGTIVSPDENIQGDVAISNGKIIKTGNLDPGDSAGEIYDASGKHVLPGIIDAHVHFRDPGLTDKEDFESGSIAAAMGGVTLIADMPNVIPETCTNERFLEKIKIAKEKSCIDFALFSLLTDNNLKEMKHLKESGALGFKVFFGTSTGNLACPSLDVLAQQMDESARLGMRIGFHAESNEINANFTSIAKSECDVPDGFWLDYARPVISEVNAIKMIVSLAQEPNIKIHIHHITSQDGAFLCGEARQNGIDLTTETCPHYLLFNNEDHVHKVLPPIRDETHREGLWEAIENGFIDMIASDHAPHLQAEKAKTTWESPAGLCGVETMVPLLLNEVNKGKISINDFVRLTSENPAKIWGCFPQKGNLKSGADACLTIVDMNMKKIIRESELHSKSKTSPYDGMEVKGLPVATIVRGAFVMKNGKFTGKKGYGNLTRPLN